MKSVIDKIKGRAIYAFLVLMVIFFTIINPNFLTVKNLLNVAKQVSIFGIASVGMTYVILLGGIDLATGSIISFVNIVCAYFMVNMGMNVVRIPTILDVQNTPYSVHSENRKIVLIYSGNPSTSKEYLAPVISVLADNPQFREAFEFHIYGPDYNKVLKNIGGDDNLLKRAEGCVFIHGKVKQELMQDIMMSADFQIFLRPHRRSSEAGFPTKLGESMAVGTPVITNLTGDIGLYLKNEVNGFVVDMTTEEDLAMTLKKITKMTDKQYKAMRLHSREKAEEAFDYRNYKQSILRLFEV